MLHAEPAQAVGPTAYLPVMTRERCAGLGALLSLVGSLLTLLPALLGGSDTAWGATLLFMPLWAGALLAVAGTGYALRLLASLAAFC